MPGYPFNVHPNFASTAHRPLTMARLSLIDYLHRGVVYSLVGLTVWGVGMSVAVHRDTMRRGRGA
ncbi:hypothetical protein BDQ17DRAFT_718773 [Cyathus striatus]|nr:hypothetical protein BDQ17DRAFT_718773 [Cyathus striatus]